MENLKKVKETILELIYPSKCPFCGEIVSAGKKHSTEHNGICKASEKEHFKNYLHLHEINRKDIDKYTTQLLSLQEMQTSPQLNAAQTVHS